VSEGNTQKTDPCPLLS